MNKKKYYNSENEFFLSILLSNVTYIVHYVICLVIWN